MPNAHLNNDLNCPIIYPAISPNSLMKATMIYEVAMPKISSFSLRTTSFLCCFFGEKVRERRLFRWKGRIKKILLKNVLDDVFFKSTRIRRSQPKIATHVEFRKLQPRTPRSLRVFDGTNESHRHCQRRGFRILAVTLVTEVKIFLFLQEANSLDRLNSLLTH